MAITFVYLALGFATAKWVWDNMLEVVEMRIQEVSRTEEDLPALRVLFFLICMLMWPLVLSQIDGEL